MAGEPNDEIVFQDFLREQFRFGSPFGIFVSSKIWYSLAVSIKPSLCSNAVMLQNSFIKYCYYHIIF